MAFMEGKAEILVVEEKRGIVEEQIRAIATRMGSRAPARITGKTGATNMPFVPTAGELAPPLAYPLLRNGWTPIATGPILVAGPPPSRRLNIAPTCRLSITHPAFLFGLPA